MIHLLGMFVAVPTVGCGSDQHDDSSASMEEAIQEACAGNCERAMQCGFDDEVEACSEECVDSLSAGLDTNRACTEADVLLYQCLSTAPCETIPLGTSCEAEIERSMSACGGGEPETSSG